MISVEFLTKLTPNSETNLTCLLLHHNAICCHSDKSLAPESQSV